MSIDNELKYTNKQRNVTPYYIQHMSEADINNKIEQISKQIKNLQLQVEELKTTKTLLRKKETKISVGSTVSFTKQPGTKLTSNYSYNPKGTVTKITNCYTYIETTEGEIVKRAHKNVVRAP